MGKLTWSRKEAPKSSSGFQAIKVVKGNVDEIAVIDAPEQFGAGKKQWEVRMSEAVVLEMFPDELGQDRKNMELKEGKFTFRYPFNITQSSAWVQGFVASGEEIGFAFPDEVDEVDFGRNPTFVGGDVGNGTVVTVEQQEIRLLNANDTPMVINGNEVKSTKFVIVAVEGREVDVEGLIRETIVGKSLTQAARDVVLHRTLGKVVGLAEKVKSGVVDVGLTVVDGVYTVA